MQLLCGASDGNYAPLFTKLEANFYDFVKLVNSKRRRAPGYSGNDKSAIALIAMRRDKTEWKQTCGN